MSSSIYSVNNWQSATSLLKNDIVTNNNLFYYAAQNFTTSSNINTDINNGNLVGYITNSNQSKPLWTWKPSYNLQGQFQPRVKSVQFGEGYQAVTPDSINNELIVLNLEFANRDLAETTAILHFLYARKGSESFVFVTPSPASAQLRFRCQQFDYVENFYNNFTVKCVFNQTVR